ncbi:MAG: polysaccharide biosynthesis/export family protein [Betaproteobacteria bacterium]
MNKTLVLAAATLLAYAGIASGADATPSKVAVSKTATADGMPSVAPAAPPGLADLDYELSPEDVLEISVWKEESLTKQVVVRPDGAFSFPLVGDVQATAKTIEQVRAEIKERLKKYIPDPVVSVSLLKVTGYKIYVIGRVNKPGEFVTGRFVDVLQALAMAGGLTPFAAENDIRILRRVQGKEYVRKFRYADVRNGENLDQNLILRSGDTVVVP